MSLNQNQNNFFRMLVFIVSCFVFAYVGLYVWLGAYASAILLFVSNLILTLLILYLIRYQKFANISRHLFIAACSLYIYATPMGIRHDVVAEFYFLPAMLATLVIFESHQRQQIIIGIFLPLIAWIMIHTGIFPNIPESLQPQQFPNELFRHLNFLGSFLLIGIIIKYFMDHTENLRRTTIQDLLDINQNLLKAEQDAHNSQKFLSSILAAIPSVVSYVDTEARYHYISPQYKTWFGIEPSEYIGKTTTDVVGEKGVEKFKPYFDRAVKGERLEFEQKIPFKNGGTRDVNMVYIPDINDLGQVLGIYLIGTDITEIRKSQAIAEQERAKSVQNARLATLGELSAGIAHEINNPLMIIGGNLSACLVQLNEREKVETRLISMQKACDRITRIVNGLRKFSRSASALPLHPHQLSSLITEVLTLTETKSKKSSVSVEVDFHTDAKILCDEIAIGQVLINLINNAIDAVKDNQEKWVRITAFEHAEKVILQVRDSGHGIPPEIAEKLFHAFFTTKPVGEGTGLGLSIIKGILEEHHATIELKQDDPNTCFEITFQKA